MTARHHARTENGTTENRAGKALSPARKRVFWIILLSFPLVVLLVTLASAFFLSKVMKLEGWVKPLILSLSVAIFIYLLFDYWLYIDLPRGILE